MNKRLLIVVGILIIAIILISGCIRQPTTPTREELIQRFSEFENQLNEKKAQGYDVTEAEEIEREAKQAFDRKDYKIANTSLDNAFESLEKAKGIPAIPEELKEEAIERLSRVKVASLYQRVTEGTEGRDIDDVINLFEETKTDFIFRGWWRWRPCPESPETAPERALKLNYTYQHLRAAVAKIKMEMPDVIFCGAIPAQRIDVKERNPITNKVYESDETWDMALGPAKWGIEDVDYSKEEIQQYFQNGPTGAGGYFPDITNPEFQELFLSLAKKQIDSGADAIWIDMLFSQARIFEKVTGNPNHPAVKESYEAASKIVDEIHEYGESKGKNIYVGTWWNFVELPYPPPNVDFVTVSPPSQEIIKKNLDEEKWRDITIEIREKLGDIPIFAFIDWAGDAAPTAVFSQKLSKEEQGELLKEIDAFSQSKGVIFVYPIHGGYMGNNAKTLSFGTYYKYDSLAPEFGTYETIKELARGK